MGSKQRSQRRKRKASLKLSGDRGWVVRRFAVFTLERNFPSLFMNDEHSAHRCVILRLRLIPRLCCAAPLVCTLI